MQHCPGATALRRRDAVAPWHGHPPGILPVVSDHGRYTHATYRSARLWRRSVTCGEREVLWGWDEARPVTNVLRLPGHRPGPTAVGLWNVSDAESSPLFPAMGGTPMLHTVSRGAAVAQVCDLRGAGGSLGLGRSATCNQCPAPPGSQTPAYSGGLVEY